MSLNNSHHEIIPTTFALQFHQICRSALSFRLLLEFPEVPLSCHQSKTLVQVIHPFLRAAAQRAGVMYTPDLVFFLAWLLLPVTSSFWRRPGIQIDAWNRTLSLKQLP